MQRRKSIGFPIKKDTFLRKNTILFVVSDNIKQWLAAGNKQITHPRKESDN